MGDERPASSESRWILDRTLDGILSSLSGQYEGFVRSMSNRLLGTHSGFVVMRPSPYYQGPKCHRTLVSSRAAEPCAWQYMKVPQQN